MKKIISLFLVVVICMLLCACTTSDYNYDTLDDSTTEKKVQPRLSNSNASSLARGYVSANDYRLESEAKRFDSEIYSISSIHIGSVSVSDGFNLGDWSNNYDLTIKGNFTAWDDYGHIVDNYNFTWYVTVDYNDYGTDWIYYSWSDDSISVTY